MPPGALLELDARDDLTGAGSGQRGTDAVARDSRVVEVSEAAGDEAVGPGDGVLRTPRAGICQRLFHVEQVEELCAEAEEHALAELEDLADAARNGGPAPRPEVGVVGDAPSRTWKPLPLPPERAGRGCARKSL